MKKLSDLNLLSIGNTIQLSGAIYSGEGQHLLCFFPDERLESVTEFTELSMDRAEWETFIRQTDLMETEMITKGADGILTKCIIRKSQRQVDQNVSWQVFKRDNYACRYCGKNDVPLTVDHLVLWEQGGPTLTENLVSACKKCNRTRGNMEYDAWLGSAFYKKVSAGLHDSIKEMNIRVAETLSTIPRMIHKRSR